MHQTCTGTIKNFRGIVAPSQVVFLSLCRFGALWSSKLLFFCPCAGLVHFEVQNVCFFLSLCRFRAPWSSKPNAFLHVYCDIISNVCKLLCLYLQCWLPMQLFEESGAFFMQRACNLNINLSFFRARFWLQEIGVFSFWNFDILKVICVQDNFLYWYLQCLWTCDHIHYIVI